MRRSLERLASALVIAPLLLTASAPAALAAGGEEAAQDLRAVEQALERERAREEDLAEKAERIRERIADLRSSLIAAAAAAQSREKAVSDLEAELATLKTEEAALEERLLRKERGLVETLAALQLLSRRPAEAVALQPASLTEASRTALVLGTVAPALKAEAARLKDELARLFELRVAIADKRESLKREAEGLEAERAKLASLIEEQWSVFELTDAERSRAAKEVAALAAQAKDLRELLAGIEERRREAPVAAPPSDGAAEPALSASELASLYEGRPEISRSIASARGFLVMPVQGMLLTAFDQKNEAGIASKGLVVETRANAVIVAPFDGEVVFAGPFRGYGLLLIIEHGEGYHTLLAGLGRIDCVLGQWLLAGQPIGVMEPDLEESPKLYVELRHDGQPIDPLPWMASDGRLARG